MMDYRMPGMNGMDAMKAILKANPNAKVIIISADYTVREKTVKGGAVAFLEKPIDFDAIDLIIAKILVK
jgi:two-component system chemotaxis response regulator CheY